MAFAALNWPEASVYIALILGASLAVSVLIWSIFRAGQTAIRSEGRRHDRVGNPSHAELEQRA
jgi:hypothetical protein